MVKKMVNPKVSIGIPSYNHEKYISETIESILNQTFQDFEIIITDDGSSDNSLDVIKSFSDLGSNFLFLMKIGVLVKLLIIVLRILEENILLT